MKLVTISPEKGSNPRKTTISDILLSRLQSLKINTQLEDPSRIFPKKRASIDGVYTPQRKRIAQKLQNPRINKITFHSICHWHGTVYYLRHGRLEAQVRLGHRNIMNMMKYILISKGYDYVTELDGVRLFRKPDHV